VTGTATALVRHSYIRELSGLVDGLVAFDAEEVGRTFHLIIDLPSWANVPLVIGVAELLNLGEMHCL